MTKKTKPGSVSGRLQVLWVWTLTEDVEQEADEAVVRRQRQQDLVDQDDVLEVVDDGLAVEEVHGRRKPVPVKALGRAKRASAARNVCDGDDLLEGHDLNSGDDDDDVNMPHEQGGKEAREHDESPERALDEVGLLLLVIGLGGSRFLFKRVSRGIPLRVWMGEHTSSTGASDACDFVRVGEPEPSSLTSLKLDLRPSEVAPLR